MKIYIELKDIDSRVLSALTSSGVERCKMVVLSGCFADDVFQAVQMVTGITGDQIKGKSRLQKIVNARYIITDIIATSGADDNEIAAILCVMPNMVQYYRKRVNELKMYDKRFRQQWRNVVDILNCE